ncbi:MAG TPA: hypothetical protein VG735_00860 [Caulobacterales bacterium]|nr:hypothetical protein [Caulobacterales bacterium]
MTNTRSITGVSAIALAIVFNIPFSILGYPDVLRRPAGEVQWKESARICAGIGFATALAIVLGTGEGLAIALGQSGEPFSLATIAGFIGLTLWLIATGIGLLRAKPHYGVTP